ncbi:MAG: AbrB/MazE/SpoVT family DNA-binding domain-containing protein [Micrococcales bacterium]|nr:AbrB/MazE/SpoVT family DNA-binding domain-containing protein [Micrococcales bacterium]MCL2666857.1 AbrB/MazE/SpoVT family DNA-binding domain-containing protein [Micrococcales bacterium]
MRKKVVRVGGSAGVTISPAELRELGVGTGDEVEVTARGGVLEIRPVDPYSQMDPDELMALIEAGRTRR